MAKLENEAHTLNEPTVLPACSSNASQGKSYGRENGNTRNRERGSYPSGQGRSIETCLYCHVSRHNEPTYWKKYPEKSPNAQKKIDQQKKTTNSSRFISNSKKNGTSFNLALQLIASNPFHYENIFDYSYKEKVANAYITQMEQRQIIDSGTSNNIAWDKQSFVPNSYETYNID